MKAFKLLYLDSTDHTLKSDDTEMIRELTQETCQIPTELN